MFNKMSGSSNSSDVNSGDAASASADAGVSQGTGLAEDLNKENISDIKTKIKNLKDDEILTLFQSDILDFPYLKIKKSSKFDGMFTMWNESEDGDIVNKVNFSSFNNTVYWAEQCDKLLSDQPEEVNESMNCKNEHLSKEEITLEYEDLPVVVYEEGSPAGYFDTDFGNWLPDEGDSKEIEIDYEYSVPKEEVSEVIKNELLEDPSKDIDSMKDLELNQYIQDHFDDLFEKYESEILNSFRDEAISSAQDYVVDSGELFEGTSSKDYFDKKAEEVQDVKLKDFWEDVEDVSEADDDYELIDTNLEMEGLDADDPDLKFTDYEWTEEDPEADSNDWEEVASKNVFDSDGFLTDYVWYTNGNKHVFVFGDSDRYRPEDGDFDWEIDIVKGKEAEGYKEAQDWFNSYKGFEDESFDFDDVKLDESKEEDSLVFDDIEPEKEEQSLTEGQMKDLDIDLKNSRSKEELIEKLEKHIAALQSELSFLQDYAPREIGRGGTFDSMEEIEEAIKLTETALAKESAKVTVLKGRANR